MEFSYTGQYRFTGDRKGDWAIEFLSSGTLRFSRLGKAGKGVDIFSLGGGGGGGRAAQFGYGGGGGGGGKTKTVRGAKIARGIDVDIIIGSGGTPNAAGGTSSVRQGSVSLCEAEGGQPGGPGNSQGYGGSGGSGGGANGAPRGVNGYSAANNTGGGGGGGGGDGGGGNVGNGGTGGSGIVIIRNRRG